MKRLLLIGYKDGAIESIYDLPYKKTKRGYFIKLIQERLEELLSTCDRVNIRVEEKIISTDYYYER